MRQTITITVEQRLLDRAKALAAQQGISLSALLGQALEELVERRTADTRVKAKAPGSSENPVHLGEAGISNPRALNDRRERR